MCPMVFLSYIFFIPAYIINPPVAGGGERGAGGVHPWTLALAKALPNLLLLHIFYCYTSFYCVYTPCVLSATCFSCDLLPSDVAALPVF
jgi:hypothetical protein